MVKNEYLTLNKLKVLQIIPKKAKKINEHQKDDSLFAAGYNLEQASRKAAEKFEDKGNPMGVWLDPIPRESKQVWTYTGYYVNGKIIKDLHSVDE
ncbi:hypothetical protein RCL_jg28870.t1 [Rhizophagus clarus]|uniref:Uncharacterized protein n=1 Tax=Rhizophagus clarus TaxID=94130 RepID=A0A8H3QUM1_9GLOM|nr:hypothetical protein RCL_jg28870.t1 [Rhizophagus clarus]